VSCVERPATTTAKRLAKLDDVAFVGGWINFCLLHQFFFVDIIATPTR
jgi:hypothetical protein